MHDENLPPNLHEGLNPAPAAASEVQPVNAEAAVVAEPSVEVEQILLEISQSVAESVLPEDVTAAEKQTEEISELVQQKLVFKDDYIAGNLDFSPEGEARYLPLIGLFEQKSEEPAPSAGDSGLPPAGTEEEEVKPVAQVEEPVAVEDTAAAVEEIQLPVGVGMDERTAASPVAEEAHRHQLQAPPAPPAPSVDPAAVIESVLNSPPQQIGGIEILIQMAEKGEIDAKNIDIIDVTDRFLKAITAVPKENLRQSGKIIFQASVLLRMKAEALLAAKVEEEFGFGDDYVDFDIDGSPIIYDANHQPIARQITLADLERALVRQTKLRQMRHRRVTLEQLIEALREAERLEAERGNRKVKPRIAIEGYNEMRDMDDILELAHDEDIEDVIARIERLLADLLEADDLLPLLRIVESLGGRGDWVDAFLAVLFLSNAGKISLQQEKFYGPLFIIRPGTEGQAGVIPPAVSDEDQPRAS